MLAGGPSHGSPRTSFVALSTTDAEYYALRCCLSEKPFGCDNFVKNFTWTSTSRPHLLRQHGCRWALSGQPRLFTTVKHIDIRWHFIRDLIRSKLNALRISLERRMAPTSLPKHSSLWTWKMRQAPSMEIDDSNWGGSVKEIWWFVWSNFTSIPSF